MSGKRVKMSASVNQPPTDVVHDVSYGETSRSRLSILRKFSYGVGHVFNDMCASMWFTYLVLFYHKVILLDNLYAGMLILIGQVADAAATPIIGFLCDITHVRYGRRKLWHLIGTCMVAISFFFLWHTCLACKMSVSGTSLVNSTTFSNSSGSHTVTPLAWEIVYFSVPIIIFQTGWASVQISHLSLIPELTPNKNERVGLNAIRYAATILSNIGVYVAMFLLLQFVAEGHSDRDTAKLTSFNVWAFHNPDPLLSSDKTENDDDISKNDVWIFSGTALGIIFFGLIFSAIFQFGTREPYLSPDQRMQQEEKNKKLPWYMWFTMPQFYMVAVIYMCTRLMNNISQAYIPLYLIDTLDLPKFIIKGTQTCQSNQKQVQIISGCGPNESSIGFCEDTAKQNQTSVAIGPLVLFVSGFLVNMLLKFLNRIIGRYMAYFIGLVLMAGGLIWFWATQSGGVSQYVVYGAIILTGAGGATVLVTSLSMVADLIGSFTGSSAFVYGLMSFTDKLSSGIAIQVIQALHPCKDYPYCCPKCADFYHNVLVFVPGGAVVLAALALVGLVAYIHSNTALQLCTQLIDRNLEAESHACSPPPLSVNSNTTYSEVNPDSPLNPPISDNCMNEKKPLLPRNNC